MHGAVQMCVRITRSRSHYPFVDLVPRQFSQANKKAAFVQLLLRISEVFMESSDDEVLSNCSLALSAMVRLKHARSEDALVQLKKTACLLRDRTVQLLQEKADAKESEPSYDDKTVCDLQYSLCLCIRRLKALSSRWDMTEALIDLNPSGVGTLCELIGEDLASDFEARSVDTDGRLPEIWTVVDPKLHAIVADTLNEGLWFLLKALAFRLSSAIDLGDEFPDVVSKQQDVLSIRKLLLKLISLCFLSSGSGDDEDDEVNDPQGKPDFIRFSSRAQAIAWTVYIDMRSLLPKAWDNATSPFLRECAMSWTAPESSIVTLVGAAISFVAQNAEVVRKHAAHCTMLS